MTKSQRHATKNRYADVNFFFGASSRGTKTLTSLRLSGGGKSVAIDKV
jgi:hypothetical protein